MTEQTTVTDTAATPTPPEKQKRTRKPRDPNAPKRTRKAKAQRAPRTKDQMAYQLGYPDSDTSAAPQPLEIIWQDTLTPLVATKRRAWRREIEAAITSTGSDIAKKYNGVQIRVLAIKDQFPVAVEQKATVRLG